MFVCSRGKVPQGCLDPWLSVSATCHISWQFMPPTTAPPDETPGLNGGETEATAAPLAAHQKPGKISLGLRQGASFFVPPSHYKKTPSGLWYFRAERCPVEREGCEGGTRSGTRSQMSKTDSAGEVKKGEESGERIWHFSKCVSASSGPFKVGDGLCRWRS